MAETSIEWTDRSWNVLRGCTRASPGCGGGTAGPRKGGCYAESIAARFSLPGQAYHGIAEMVNGKPRWTGKISFMPEALFEPLKIRKPSNWFVNSMSDLFHEDVPDPWIDQMVAIMALTPRHTYQSLTKRSARMRRYLSDPDTPKRVIEYIIGLGPTGRISLEDAEAAAERLESGPLPNCWWGVSCENQKYADERVPDLIRTPAAVRFVSAEPLLDGIDFRTIPGLDDHDSGGVMPALLEISWTIVGGESGGQARPFHFAWARSIVAQCKAAGVPVFVKQLGAKPVSERGPVRFLNRKGGDMEEWPRDLRVREMPARIAA